MQHVREHSISRPNSVSTVPGWVDTTEMLLSFNLLFIKYISITYKYINRLTKVFRVIAYLFRFMLKYIRQGTTTYLQIQSECRPRSKKMIFLNFLLFILWAYINIKRSYLIFTYYLLNHHVFLAPYIISYSVLQCYSVDIVIFPIRCIILYIFDSYVTCVKVTSNGKL